MIPNYKRAIIEPEESKSVLVSAENKLTQVGKVISVGAKPWYRFWEARFLREGDRVVFLKWGIDMVEVDGKEYFFLADTEEFVLAKL